MRVVALASGSSGNALWVQAGATSVLLDAGLGPRTLAQRLASVGGALHKVTALLLTHEHDDHVRGVSPLVQRYGLPAVGTPGTLRATLGGDGEQCVLRPGGELRVGELVVRALAVEHDALEPAAFEVEHDGVRLLVAVDLGSVGQDLLDRGRLADLLVVDCNHDEERLWRGPYPALLKRRIAAPTGHLSNAQAAAFVAACATARRQTVWLAHLSAVNNTPALALAAVRETLAVQGLVAPVLVAARDRVSLRWDSDAPAGEQLGLPDLHGES